LSLDREHRLSRLRGLGDGFDDLEVVVTVWQRFVASYVSCVFYKVTPVE
jgi:hypothetical protein